MIKIYNEDVKSDFKGTIIDIESIGDFCNFSDSRRYMKIVPVIFGYLNRDSLSIFCAENKESIDKLKSKIVEILNTLERPFYAFNCDFESGVFFHNLNNKIIFDEELNTGRFETKSNVISLLKIPQYNDPFFDKGKLCMESWINGDIEKSIAHNRSCLLKERDILLKRGSRKPDLLKFIKD